MLSLITGLPAFVRCGLIAVAVAGVSAGAAYFKGRSDARAAARVEALQATMEQLQERNATDAEIGNMDDAGLCRLLGGEWVPDTGCR